MTYLSVSAFAADATHMNRDLQTVRKSGADFLHMDVMDGRFVPLCGLEPNWLMQYGKATELPVDVHLMTCQTARTVDEFLALPIHSLLFHVEAEPEQEARRLLQHIRAQGVLGGLAISPETPVEGLEPFLAEMDEVLIMCTAPGCPDTVFNRAAYKRIRKLRKMARQKKAPLVISVDGGIDKRIAARCIQSGADKIIMGRAFFSSAQPALVAAWIHASK